MRNNYSMQAIERNEKMEKSIDETEKESEAWLLTAGIAAIYSRLWKTKEALDYYCKCGVKEANEIEKEYENVVESQILKKMKAELM